MRRWQCCGADMTWLARCIPCSAWVAPEWWYRYSRRQRRIILTLAAFAAALLVLGLLLFILVASTSGLQAQHRNAEGGKAVSSRRCKVSRVRMGSPEPTRQCNAGRILALAAG